MAKLGLLFLRRGEWDGAQLIDAGVDAATSPQAPGRPFPEGVGYGYLWWVDDLACPPTFFAAGHGGQYVYAVPAFDLVAVTTADAHAESRVFGRTLRSDGVQWEEVRPYLLYSFISAPFVVATTLIRHPRPGPADVKRRPGTRAAQGRRSLPRRPHDAAPRR